MRRKDKVLVIYDEYYDLIGTVVFNKITKENGYDIFLDNNIIKIIIDNRKHKLVNCYGNTYKVISTEESDLDR